MSETQNPTPSVLASTTYLNALTSLIRRRVDRGAFGVLLLGLPDVPVRDVSVALGGPGDVWVSLVGLEDAAAAASWAWSQGWTPEQFGADTDATHAVMVRNSIAIPSGKIRLVIAAEDVNRLHSLTERGYVRLGPDEVIQEIAAIGETRAPTPPQRNLWSALARPAVIPFLSLDGVLGYYDSLFASTADPLDQPRRELPRLGLLRDPQLLTGNAASVPAIERRLLLNSELVERARQAHSDDRQKALRSVQAAPELLPAYRALIRLGRGDSNVIRELTLADVQRLIVTAPKKGTPSVALPLDLNVEPIVPDPPAPKYSEPSEAALDWAVTANAPQLDELVNEVVKHLARDEKLDQGKLRVSGWEIDFEPDPRALALTRTLATRDVYGGTLQIDEALDSVLANLGPHVERFQRFDALRMRTLRHYLERATPLVEGFDGLALLDDYLAKRTVLTESAGEGVTHGDLLASRAAAFLYLVARPLVLEAARAAIHAYERLLDHLEARFHELAAQSAQGAARIYSEVLALDLFILRAKDEVGALVSPLSPLTLWKHVEIATLVLGRGADLSASDLEILRAELADMPEPLLALYVPEVEQEEAAELVFVGRIGEIPLYRPSTVEAADVGADSIEEAARKLRVLYPPAREELRVLLLNPRSLDAAAAATRRLLYDKEPFRRVNLTVARTHGVAPPPPAKLDELHADGRVSVTLLPTMELPEIGQWLASQPVHLLVIAGEQQRNAGLVGKEGTRLHPLSIPRRMEADPITESLSLQPRSNRPDAEGVQHPYALYHDVVSVLSQKPRSDRTVREHRRAALDDYKALFPNCLFSIVAGTPEERVSHGMLRLSQGSGPMGDTVFTRYDSRVIHGFTQLIRQGNYVPSADAVRLLLRRIEEVGGEGVFSTISEAGRYGFSETALQGQIGMAVALCWYREQAAAEAQSLVISLDSQLARKWLGRRDDSRRTDLLGFRRTASGELCIDVIEVKGYAATNDTHLDRSSAAGQLRVIGRLLHDMLRQQGDLLLDRRRELLRLQVFQEGLLDARGVDTAWVRTLNEMLDGTCEVVINLMLIEVDMSGNDPLRDEVFEAGRVDGDPVDRLSIRRVRLSEPGVRRYLGELLPSDRTETAEPEFALSWGESAGFTIDDLPTQSSYGGAGETPVVSSRPSDEGEVESVDAASASVDLGFEPTSEERAQISAKAKDIYRALEDLHIGVNGPVDAELADVGPSVIRYKVRLTPGERVSTLQGRARDLMRELAVEKEPIIDNLPGTSFVHIDLPRSQRRNALLRPVLEAARGSGTLTPFAFPAGVTPDGEVEWLSIADLPHMLVAGSTGSGKSVFLYSLIAGLAYLHTPAELQLVLVDPKRTDFLFFSRLPHLHGRGLITDAQEAVTELRRLIDEEMEERTRRLEEGMFRNIHSYNARHPAARIRPIVVVIDEFADLSDLLGTGDHRSEFDLALRRLAQRARSVGIHLVIATQRPTADVVNGTLKANLPCRVSFRLGSGIDSRTILDEGGAEHLLGAGDMLIKRESGMKRLQSFYVDEDTLRDLVLDTMARVGGGL